MRTISVTPDQLDTCALRMNDAEDAYSRDCDALFNEVDALGSAWQGKDNLAFVSQISGFRNDFHQIAMLCSEYADFLRNSARSYRCTQDELTAQASRLER
ncbi:MAG: WXG100 family type VII secretion target [Solobacterium sp.]|nr:WXG100 family type VII secretion target [Solobacterium sp.]MCH4205632.1 WXG100 family type VII secretion target [Solobacterium sp.]MCH4227175.1 WXG100 family type VII secretion target [Solobacterium sp.]MCH4282462.1 WXG100 family type VII secretion target [Solobacterium sp.]